MHIYRVEMHVQLQVESAFTATWTKIHKDACTVTRTALAAGSALEGSKASSYSAILLSEMRGSETFACECETFPTEARKKPEAEFHAQMREGCSVVRWSGWWFSPQSC